MMKKIPVEFLHRIPKADLHVHLDGSLRLATLIELAKKDGIALPAYTEEGLRKKVFKDKYNSLVEYLRGFAYTKAVMQSAQNIERIAYELGQDTLKDGVRYLEVRFAPQQHINEHLTVEQSLRAAVRGLARAQREHNTSAAVKKGEDLPFYFGIIACAMRNFDASTSAYYASILKVLSQMDKNKVIAIASLELAKAVVPLIEKEHLPIVGFDIAGEEAGYPASNHILSYQYAHKHFLCKTVHAGEAYGPESIFSAITDCYANRIGHGTNLFETKLIQDKSVKDKKAYVEGLSNYLAQERIGIEVCLTSNLQTRPDIKSIRKHPVGKMIQHGLSVCINTDNRLVSNTTLTKEFELLTREVELTPNTLRNLVVAGFKNGFFPGTYLQKRSFVHKVLERYRELEKTYQIS